LPFVIDSGDTEPLPFIINSADTNSADNHLE
jgi:hypothetical protein